MTTHLRRILVFAALVLGAGCGGGGGVKNGAAFIPPAHVMVRITYPIPVGEQTGVLIADLKNVSGAPIKVTSVRLLGSGIGHVLTVKSNQIAPFGDPLHSTPAGIFRASPPVIYYNKQCHVQTLEPIGAGWPMQPNQEARIFTVVTASGVGKSVVRDYQVFYTEQGTRYQQTLTIGMSFIVTDGAKPRALSPDERQCRAQTKPLSG